jgi:hypothetical protein
MSGATANPDPPSNWTRNHTAGCLAAVAAIVVVALAGAPPVISWLLYLLLMATFTAIVADGITDSRAGILIDERNRMSLSRLQMALWSLIVISAFLAAAISNIRGNAPLPLNIGIPEAVWLLMGISTTSLVGGPLVLSAKRATPQTIGPPTTPVTPAAPAPPLEAMATGPTAPVAPPPPIPVTASRKPLPVTAAAVLRAQGEDPTRMSVDGSVVVRHSVSDASWADLFKGDEVGDITTLDLAKIQMFFFTVVLVISYGIALAAKFLAIDAARREMGPEIVATAPGSPGKTTSPDPRLFDQFPPLDLGFVTILGISNAGFLVNRAIPRDQLPPPPP